MQFLTDPKLNLLNLRKLSLLIPFLILISLSASSQIKESWKYISSVDIVPAEKVSTDINNFLYTSDEAGNIYKYDSLGKFLFLYSSSKKTEVSLIEGSRGLNVFLFYREYQQYRLLNRFLTELSVNSFDRNQTGFVRLATLSADNNLWVIDEDQFSLKKINLTFNRIEVENSLQLVLPPGEYNFVFIREYENKVYVADSNSGILVFDNLGNFITSISSKGVKYFNFQGKILYFILNEKLHLLNLSKGTRKVEELPEGVKGNNIILSKNKAYIFTPSQLKIYEHQILF